MLTGIKLVWMPPPPLCAKAGSHADGSHVLASQPLMGSVAGGGIAREYVCWLQRGKLATGGCRGQARALTLPTPSAPAWHPLATVQFNLVKLGWMVSYAAAFMTAAPAGAGQCSPPGGGATAGPPSLRALAARVICNAREHQCSSTGITGIASGLPWAARKGKAALLPPMHACGENNAHSIY